MPAVRIAPLFDPATPDGSVPISDGRPFAPTRPSVDDPVERQRLTAYLRSGTLILFTTATDTDRVDRTRGAVVPMSFRTDGVWVWSEAVTYYLSAHRVAPAAEFYRHIAANRYAC